MELQRRLHDIIVLVRSWKRDHSANWNLHDWRWLLGRVHGHAYSIIISDPGWPILQMHIDEHLDAVLHAVHVPASAAFFERCSGPSDQS